MVEEFMVEEFMIKKSRVEMSSNLLAVVLYPADSNMINLFKVQIVDRNGHFWTTYPPNFVHAVVEQPLLWLEGM